MTIESLQTAPTVQTITELTKQYYKTQVSAAIDTDKMARVIDYNITCYNNPFTSSDRMPVNLSRMEEIDLLLQTNKYVNINKLCAYQHDYIQGGGQYLVAKHAQRLKEGYTTVLPEDHNLRVLFQNYLVMRKPQEMIDAEIADIKKAITSLFEEKAEIERKELMSAEKATAWAIKTQKEQEATYNAHVAIEAAKEAQATNTMFEKFGCFMNEIESKDFWFFGDVQKLVGCTENEAIENLLTYLKLVPVRKYLADQKQHMIWVQEEKLDSIDFKTIEYTA
ncbi:hypothetical protein [Vibrio diazotrophicus]|uniref:hypothetical protein n=1 Tax=Vibrio diazotrophicus TaxID=685 RepID=UPI00142DA13D|nr:hypothetical protein [Vibrio diazotrophicus]NIY94577.1 hypothetical protein [Vibrio diazotrophicus]